MKPGPHRDADTSGPDAPSARFRDDRPDLSEDVFGHEDYAVALADAVRGAPNGISMALFGPFGIGKTSILRALQRSLASGRGEVAVIFDAWRYRDDAFRREFLRDVAGQLLDARVLRGFSVAADLRDLDVDVAGVEERLAFGWRRLAVFVVTVVVPLLVAALAASGVLVDSSRQRVTVAGLATLVAVASAGLGRLLGLRTETHTRVRLEDPDRFSRRFREMVAATRAERLVIAIDNLDRLAPDAAVDVLSTVKTFLEPAVTTSPRRAPWRRDRPAPTVVFLVAADDVALRRHVEATADVEEAEEFLRKLFAVRLTVRPVLDDDLEGFVARQVAPLLERWAPWDEDPFEARPWRERHEAELVAMIVAGLRATPRRVNQFVNSIEMAMLVLRARRAAGRLDRAVDDISLVALMVLVEEEFPRAFAGLLVNEGLLTRWRAAAESGSGTEGVAVPEWPRLAAVLRSTQAVGAADVRGLLTLKLTARERELPQREEILAALMSGGTDEVAMRLDPSHLRDDAPLSASDDGAERAAPWAARIPHLVARAIRRAQPDRALNLLRGAVEVDVLYADLPAAARSVEAALSDASIRQRLHVLPTERLVAISGELPDASRDRLLLALAESWANGPVDDESRTALAASLAAAPLPRPAVAVVRDALVEQRVASTFALYAPLARALPGVLNRSAAAMALEALRAATAPTSPPDVDRQDTHALRLDGARRIARLERGPEGVVLYAALRDGLLDVDGLTAAILTAGLGASEWEPDGQRAMMRIVEAVARDGQGWTDETASGVLEVLEVHVRVQARVLPETVRAWMALLGRVGSPLNRARAVIGALRGDGFERFVDEHDRLIAGPVRQAALLQARSAPALTGEARERLAARLDPERLATDVDPEILADEIRRWIDADARRRAELLDSLGDAGMGDRAAMAQRANLTAVGDMEPADVEDPDAFTSVLHLEVDVAISAPDDPSAIGPAVVDVEMPVAIVIRLRRDAADLVDAQVICVDFDVS